MSPVTRCVLAVVEHDEGRMSDTSRELLTFARGIAEAEGVTLEAVAFGSPAMELAGELGHAGVATLHVVDHELLTDYAPQAWAACVGEIAEAQGATVVAAAGTDRGNEVLAHVASLRDLPLAANCTAAEPGEVYELTRLRWGGILLEDARLSAPVKLLTVAPHTVTPALASEPSATTVEKVSPTLDESLLRTRVRERVTREGGVSLASAPVVVSGGRGVGSEEGFAPLEELAQLLGGAVGCSRVATNNGWRSHSDQVGQTGTRIAPDLYIACGISGATQHWVGCMASKRILAINTDAEAPMVTRAHYAVLGDVGEVLPAIVAEVRTRRGTSAEG